MKSLFLTIIAASVLAGCTSFQQTPWTFRNKETGTTTTTNVSQGIVRADLKRQVVDACITNLDDINKQANASFLVGKAPGGYEWYATNPNARVYGPQDCRNLMITGMDIANNAVAEVRGVIGSLANALPWVAVAKLGKYGFEAAGTRLSTREGDINFEQNTDTIRDTYGSELNSGSTVDNSVRQESSDSVLDYTPSAPSQSSSSSSNTTTTTTTYPPGTEITPDPEAF